jgi:hypothetical protein
MRLCWRLSDVVCWIITVRIFNRFFIVAFAVLVVESSGRADDQIRSYDVPKEQPSALVVQSQAAQTPMAQSPMAQGAPDIPVNASPVQWTLPSGWQQLPPDGIRIGNFVVPGKDDGQAAVAITSFPGEVGTELANVNRWRQQLDLAPVEENEAASTPVTVGSSDGKLFDLAGSTARMVVALVRRNGATWFFKMTGDAGTVAEAKPVFIEFLKSIRFGDEGNSASTMTTTTTADAAGNPMPKWSVPSNWEEKTPGPMLFKSFSVAGNDGATAAVTVSFFPGAMGGALANVNRWRGQLGLSPIAEDQLGGVARTLETAAGPATLVDAEGAGAKAGQRLVAVMLAHGDNTWFYKLLGDKALVAREKDTFVNFVKAVQYP